MLSYIFSFDRQAKEVIYDNFLFYTKSKGQALMVSLVKLVAYLSLSYRKEFPKLVSYSRFVQLMPMSFMPMVLLLKSLSGKQTGQYYITSVRDKI
uniref:hypothetical protein n=1 Tax=Rickettsia endosymbiont of Oedothorax gibbosus TaxID=931099 RepID=UPI0020253FFC|nr:hypothetical protein [Rickettsia endosymbiont of Oedothorax gibbosus]